MGLKNMFANPRFMALSGWIAMLLKGIATSVLSFSLGLFFIKNGFWSFCLLLYPIVGTIFDVMLYGFKNKLWKIPPNPEVIPEDWEVTSEELLKFAKDIPKVRLMRYVGCLMLLPLMPFDKESVFTIIFSCILIGYFVFVLFDWVWLRIFNIKRPQFIFKVVSSSRGNSYLNDISERLSRQNNPSIPGTSAWFAQKNIDSM